MPLRGLIGHTFCLLSVNPFLLKDISACSEQKQSVAEDQGLQPGRLIYGAPLPVQEKKRLTPYLNAAVNVQKCSIAMTTSRQERKNHYLFRASLAACLPAIRPKVAPAIMLIRRHSSSARDRPAFLRPYRAPQWDTRRHAGPGRCSDPPSIPQN